MTILILIIGIPGLFIFFFNMIKESRLAYKDFLEYEFNGVIIDISEGQRGYPTIHFKDTTIYLDIHEAIIHKKIIIGDSIVKVKNSDSLIIYRKNEDLVWEKFFQHPPPGEIRDFAEQKK